MTANTVYDVFLALPSEEREKLIVLVNQEKKKNSFDLRNKKTKPISITRQEAIDYLLATVFKPKKTTS